MKQLNQIRQGDVFLQRIDTVPEGFFETPKVRDAVVLAYGEVTGHAHKLVGQFTKMLTNNDGERIIKLVAPDNLLHEEHTAPTLPVGNYEIIQQREYSPEAIRNVMD